MKKNRLKIAIFCESYVQIDRTVAVVSMHSDKRIVIFTIHKSVHDALILVFRSDERIKVVLIGLFVGKISSTNKNINRLLRLLAFIMYFKSGLDYDSIYFFSRYFNLSTYFAVKFLTNKNIFYIYPLERSYSERISVLRNGRTLKAFLSRFLRIITKGDVDLVMFSTGVTTTRLTAKYCRRLRINSELHPLSNANNQILSAVQNINKKVVYYDVGKAVVEWFGGLKSYQNFIDELFSLLIEIYGVRNIAVKKHPTSESEVDYPVEISEIPRYIPAQWFDEFVDIKLSIFSSSCYFSKYGKCIILSRFLSEINQELSIELEGVAKGRMINDRSYFPASFVELANNISK